jgi:hypothetical protein
MALSILNTSAIAALCLFGPLLAGCGPREPETQGSQIEARRLTEAQYRQSIADIFGPDIQVAGRFQPELRTDGLLAVGATEVTIAGSGFEQYYGMASNIAAQVTDAAHRDRLIPCKPASATDADDVCETTVFRQYGETILRHPLDPARLKRFVAVSSKVAAERHDFYSGIAFTLTGLLSEPDFLFRVERTEPDPDKPGHVRLDGYSKASRLSFFLWNTTPDAALLAAADKGELDTRKGLRAQVDRMLSSPRTEAGVRAFFSDFLAFDTFDSLEKDGQLFPAFNQKTAADAKEQTLRTITDHLIARKGDYRDLFTTRRTFLTRALGRVYAVPVVSRTGWDAYEFPQDDPRAGILTQPSFTALHAHPGRSSATLRGKALRELLLCQKVPTPPANVNFNLVQDTSNPNYKTARQRLTAHRSEATCAGCHKIMDPIGLALESFDGAGQFRATENGAAIDNSGELDGVSFSDAAGLGRAMHDNPATASCLVTSLYGYAAGHKPLASEKDWMTWLRDGFSADGYRVPDLMRRIASSEAFYRVADEPAGKAGQTASLSPNLVKEASK